MKRKTDRKTVAIIFFGLGCLLASIYFIYPPFGYAIADFATLAGTTLYNFVLAGPFQVLFGGFIVAGVWLAKRWDVARAMRIAGNRNKEVKKELGTFETTREIVRENPTEAKLALEEKTQ